MLELDYNIGRIMDTIRAEAPNTIVVITADNGAWQDAFPDAGTTSVPRREGHRPSRPAGAFPGIMWAPGKIPAGQSTPRDDVAHGRVAHDGHDGRPDSADRTASGRTTTASRSTSTASTTLPTSPARPGIRRAIRGSTLTAKTSKAYAPTSGATRTNPGSGSPGRCSTRRKTPGWGRS